MTNENKTAWCGLLWFIGLWLTGVAMLGVAALAIRLALTAAGLRT